MKFLPTLSGKVSRYVFSIQVTQEIQGQPHPERTQFECSSNCEPIQSARGCSTLCSLLISNNPTLVLAPY